MKTWNDLTKAQQCEYERLDAAIPAAESAPSDEFFAAVSAKDGFRELHNFDLPE